MAENAGDRFKQPMDHLFSPPPPRSEGVIATLTSLLEFPDCNVKQATYNALKHVEKIDLAGIVVSLTALWESSDRQMHRLAFDALQKLTTHIDEEESEGMKVRTRTRADNKRFQYLCWKEEMKNRNISRVLLTFLKKCRGSFIQIRGASYHMERILEIVYNHRTYEARIYENMKDMGATLVFGQDILAVVNMETLAEACRRIGGILNEAIRSFVEVDLLYALPNPELHSYDWDDFNGYRVYEVQVCVDFKNPTQLSYNDLKDITSFSSQAKT